jgi:hypothetical protein
VPSVPPPPTAPPGAPSPLPLVAVLCSQPPLGPIAPSLGSGALNAASATGGDADTPAASWVAAARLVVATPRRSNAAVRLFPCFMATHVNFSLVCSKCCSTTHRVSVATDWKTCRQRRSLEGAWEFRRRAPAFRHLRGITSTAGDVSHDRRCAAACFVRTPVRVGDLTCGHAHTLRWSQ